MAIFHLAVHDRVSRSAGQSSVNSAAYIMRKSLTDERTGETFDHSWRDAALWSAQCVPKGAPEWMQGRKAHPCENVR